MEAFFCKPLRTEGGEARCGRGTLWTNSQLGINCDVPKGASLPRRKTFRYFAPQSPSRVAGALPKGYTWQGSLPEEMEGAKQEGFFFRELVSFRP